MLIIPRELRSYRTISILASLGIIGKNMNDLKMKGLNIRKLSDLGNGSNNLSVLRNKGGNDKIIPFNLDYGGTRNAGDRDDSAGRERQEDLRDG